MECQTSQWSVARIYREFNDLELSPEYQREAGVWSTEKEQLLIDSLISGFDIPKIYFHRLPSGAKKYAVVDGKQRLTAILNFMNDVYALASGNNAGCFYGQLSPDDQDRFKEVQLDVVVISDSDLLEIEDLFFRLNNGEALNNAEKRNAIGGDMASFIAEVSSDEFFQDYVSFEDKRFAYREAAAPLVLAEDLARQGASPIADCKKAQLDTLVRGNRAMDASTRRLLSAAVAKNFRLMKRVFVPNDPMLRKPSWLLHYYLTVRKIAEEYNAANLPVRIRDSFEQFERLRSENLGRPESERDPVLMEFGLMVQQGSRSKTSLEKRVSILVRNFLQTNPDLTPSREARFFTRDQRYTIWLKAQRKCQAPGCTKTLDSPEDGEADHVIPFSKGGLTSVENGQFLCRSCNLTKGDGQLEQSLI